MEGRRYTVRREGTITKEDEERQSCKEGGIKKKKRKYVSTWGRREK